MYLTEPYDHEFEFIDHHDRNFYVHFKNQLELFWKIYFSNLIFKLEYDENLRGRYVSEKIIIYKNNYKGEYELGYENPYNRIGEINFERIVQDRNKSNYVVDVMVLYLGDKKYLKNSIHLKSFEHLKFELERELHRKSENNEIIS